MPNSDTKSGSRNDQWKQAIENTRMVAHARAYLKKRWAVVPLWWVESPEIQDPDTGEVTPARCACHAGDECRSAGKHPIPKHGTKDAVTDGLRADVWWGDHPLANVGIVTGKISGLVVLDVDPDKGGFESMKKIVDRYGELPATVRCVTGSGGRHIYFRHPGGEFKNAIDVMPGLDIRSDGGLVVAPPSFHAYGHRYVWDPNGHPAKTKVAPMPEWMEKIFELDGKKRKKRNRRYNARKPNEGKYGRLFDPSSVPAIAQGARNETLCSITGRLIWEARSESEVAEIVHGINEKCCTPPLNEREVTRLVRNAYRRWRGGKTRDPNRNA